MPARTLVKEPTGSYMAMITDLLYNQAVHRATHELRTWGFAVQNAGLQIEKPFARAFWFCSAVWHNECCVFVLGAG
jgi:predicted component of type VI protein secretion system